MRSNCVIATNERSRVNTRRGEGVAVGKVWVEPFNSEKSQNGIGLRAWGPLIGGLRVEGVGVSACGVAG